MSPAQRQRVLAPIALLTILSISSSCSDEAASAGSSVSVPDIAINLASPGINQPLKDTFKVSGTLTNTSKLSAASLKTTLRFKGYEDQVAEGPAAVNFSFDVDPSATGPGDKPLAKDGKFCGTLSATGVATKDKEVTASGSMQVCVLLDRVAPTIKISGPLPSSTHIGKFLYSGQITDKNLFGAQVTVDKKLVVGWCQSSIPGDCEKCLNNPKTPEVKKCMSGPGSFEVLVDRTGMPSGTVKLWAAAQDTAGTSTVEERDINVLKAPSFDIARRDAASVLEPGAEPGTVVEAIKHGEIRSFELGDFDGDAIIDVVMGTTLGVYLRRGLAMAGNGDGEAAVPVGRFGLAELIVNGDIKHLSLVDLDQDDVLDVVAVGVLSDDKSGVVFMLTRPGGAGVGGLRPVQSQSVQATVQAVAAADLNADGATDIVLGGLEDETALTVLYLIDGPLCPSSADPKRKCKGTGFKALGSAALVHNTIEHKLLGSVTSLAIADFIADDADPPLLDVAIGRDKPAISVCNNIGNTLGACIETNQSGFLYDLKDAKFISAVHWNDDDGDGAVGEGPDDFPDLIVATKAGMVRWVTGDHKGSFFFDAPVKFSYRTYDFGAEITSIHVAPTGAGGSAQVLVAYGGRTVTGLPVDPNEGTDITQCFRSFVLGQSIDNVRAADLDGDDILDLVGLSLKEALVVANGKGEGEYRAAAIHRVCGLKGLYGPSKKFSMAVLDVAQFGVHDLTGDKRQDLLLVSESAVATVAKPTDQGPQPQPAIYFGLYTGTADGLNKAVRTGEFGPYNTSPGMDEAGIKDKDTGGLGKSLPPVSGLAFAEINGSAPVDMILAFDTSYSTGSDAIKGVGSNANGDILACASHELLEMMNIFGEESPESKDLLSQQCKFYGAIDKEKKSPLHGYGGGAYLDRASLTTWIGNQNNPFEIGPNTPPDAPGAIAPYYAQSGGIGIVDIAVGDFDGDTNADVAALMRGVSDDLQARVRLFKGLGSGRIGPIFYVEKDKGKTWPLPEDLQIPGCPGGDMVCFITRYCTLNDTTCTIVKVPLDELSLVPAGEGSAPSIWSPVTYRVVAPHPLSIAAAPFCDDATASLFTLSNTDDGVGSITWLRRLSAPGFFSRQKSISIGENLRAFKPIDVTQDGCTDLLCGLNKKMGFTTGGVNAFGGNEYFDVAKANRTAVDTMDLNQDGWVDLVAVNAENDTIEIWLGSLLKTKDGGTKFEFKKYPQPMFGMVKSTKMIQADLNSDGCPDLAVKGKNGVAVYINTGCPPAP